MIRLGIVGIPSSPGAYVFTHVPTGKFYIGATSNLRYRYHSHIFDYLTPGKKWNTKLANANPVREDISFEYQLFDSIEEAMELEKGLLRKNIGLNLCINVSYGDGHSIKTLATREKMRLSKVGLPKSKKVSIEGREFTNSVSAAFELGLSIEQVRSRVKSRMAIWKDWFYS